MSQKVSYRIFAVLTIFAILLISCSGGSSNKLIGTWEYKEPTSGLTIQATFTKDKVTITGGGTTMLDSAYTYVDSKTIKFVDPTTKQEQSVNYSISGSELTISFAGQSLKMIKVK